MFKHDDPAYNNHENIRRVERISIDPPIDRVTLRFEKPGYPVTEWVQVDWYKATGYDRIVRRFLCFPPSDIDFPKGEM